MMNAHLNIPSPIRSPLCWFNSFHSKPYHTRSKFLVKIKIIDDRFYFYLLFLHICLQTSQVSVVYLLVNSLPMIQLLNQGRVEEQMMTLNHFHQNGKISIIMIQGFNIQVTNFFKNIFG